MFTRASLPFPAADPAQRPPMQSVMVHPLWWPAPQRLAFLIAVSDRVEGEDRAVSLHTLPRAFYHLLPQSGNS